MKRSLMSTVGAAIGLLVFSSSTRAHHGDADRYDTNVVIVTGTLVEFQLVNPHSIVAFDVTDANGQTVRWQAEMGGSQQLVKEFGWSKTSVKVGDKITVTGRRAKSGAPYMNLTERSSIVLIDSGKEIFHTGTKNRGDLQ
jgi:ribulose-5-phosphate 4-epimerase/fuculose-1-phosphate aldolase